MDVPTQSSTWRKAMLTAGECRRVTLLCWNSKGSSWHMEEVAKLVNRRWALCLFLFLISLYFNHLSPSLLSQARQFSILNLNPSISTKATSVWKDLNRDKTLAAPINLPWSLASNTYGRALLLLWLVGASICWLAKGSNVRAEERRSKAVLR